MMTMKTFLSKRLFRRGRRSCKTNNITKNIKNINKSKDVNLLFHHRADDERDDEVNSECSRVSTDATSIRTSTSSDIDNNEEVQLQQEQQQQQEQEQCNNTNAKNNDRRVRFALSQNKVYYKNEEEEEEHDNNDNHDNFKSWHSRAEYKAFRRNATSQASSILMGAVGNSQDGSTTVSKLLRAHAGVMVSETVEDVQEHVVLQSSSSSCTSLYDARALGLEQLLLHECFQVDMVQQQRKTLYRIHAIQGHQGAPPFHNNNDEAHHHHHQEQTTLSKVLQRASLPHRLYAYYLASALEAHVVASASM